MYKELFCLIVLGLSQSAQVVQNYGSSYRVKQGCVFPSHPEHGTYVTNVPEGKPGDSYNYLVVNVTCNQNYVVEGSQSVSCYNGWWPKPIPKCVLSPESTQAVDENSNSRETTCVFPSHPEHGTYVTNVPEGRPGDSYNYLVVNVTCNQNYIVEGSQPVSCFNGWWPQSIPKCVLSPQAAELLEDSANRPQGKCVLPPYPKHGTYTTNVANGTPGIVYDYFNVNVSCHQGYNLEGSVTVFCFYGQWFQKMPKCLPLPLGLSTTGGDDDRFQSGNLCILPPFPAHATYTTNIPGAKPGEAYDIVVYVNITCNDGYVLNGPHLIYCSGGLWQTKIPQCLLRCRLPRRPSLSYGCLVTLEGQDGERFRTCNEYEPEGTLAKPQCRTHYHSPNALAFMECKDGEWSNNDQRCIPECGTLTEKGTQLILNATIAKLGDVPWHAAIYRKNTDPYELICGGSLISSNIVISAAHCFWDSLVGKLHPSEYVVALGKLYRDVNSKMDLPQWSNVESLQIPPRFKQSKTNFQDDIAVVQLSTEIKFQKHIRPVCVDFEARFERRQLQPGNKGKVAGWGLTTEFGNESKELRMVDLPFVPVEMCYDKVPETFSAFITSDKICAGYINAGTALCKGDSGGGLSFLGSDRGTNRYYLRGVASTAPTNDKACNGDTYTTFTRVLKHENFITKYWRV